MSIDNSLLKINLYRNQNIELNKSKNLTQLKQSCDNFESEILKHFLEESLKNENSLYPKSAGEDIYRSMYKDELSKQIAGDFGYSKLLFEYLKDKVN